MFEHTWGDLKKEGSRHTSGANILAIQGRCLSGTSGCAIDDACYLMQAAGGAYQDMAYVLSLC